MFYLNYITIIALILFITGVLLMEALPKIMYCDNFTEEHIEYKKLYMMALVAYSLILLGVSHYN